MGTESWVVGKLAGGEDGSFDMESWTDEATEIGIGSGMGLDGPTLMLDATDEELEAVKEAVLIVEGFDDSFSRVRGLLVCNWPSWL